MNEKQQNVARSVFSFTQFLCGCVMFICITIGLSYNYGEIDKTVTNYLLLSIVMMVITIFIEIKIVDSFIKDKSNG